MKSSYFRSNPFLSSCGACAASVFVTLSLLSTQSATAASAAWNVDAAGNWATDANWNPASAPGIADGITFTNPDIATFGFTLTVARAVTVDANRNIGGITFGGNNTAFAYTLSSGNLLLSTGGIIQVDATATAGTHTDAIGTPVQIQGDGGTASFTSNGAPTRALSITQPVTGVSTGVNVTALTLDGITPSLLNSVSGAITNGTAGGALSLTKSGIGTWVISGANTYSGGTTVNLGTLVSQNANSLGSNGSTVTLAGGSLSLRGNANNDSTVQNINYNKALTVTGNATLDVQRQTQGGMKNIQLNTLAIGGQTLTLTNNFGYSLQVTGATTLSGNATFAQTMNNFGGGGGQPTVAQTGLVLGDFTVANAVSPATTTTATFNVTATTGINTGNVAINGVAADNLLDPTKTLAITKSGAGTLILGGTNTYTGATTISAGTLQLGNGGTTGTIPLASPITNDGTLAIRRSNTVTQGTDFGVVSGIGSLSQIGTGALVLTANNTYTGGTSASLNTLTLDYSTNTGMKIGNAASNGALTLAGATFNTLGTAGQTELVKGLVIGAGTSSFAEGAVNFDFTANSGTLTRNNNGFITFDPAGAGSVKVAGAANTILGSYATVGENFAARDANGLITAFSGYVDNDFTAGNVVNVTTASNAWGGTSIGSLKFSNGVPATVTITGTGSFAADGGILVGSAVGSNNILITGGILATAANDDLIVTTNNSGTLEIASTITQTGVQGITKLGVGALKLSGVTAITGNIVIGGGTLEIANPANLTFAGAITGTGALVKSGNSTLALTSTANTLSGPTTINGGTLHLNGTVNAGAGTAPVLSNSAITINQGAALKAELVGNAVVGASLTMNGGSFTVGGPAGYTQSANRNVVWSFPTNLALGAGANTLAVNNTQNGGTQPQTLRFAGLNSHTAGSTALFRTASYSAQTFINFTTAPTAQLVGGGGVLASATTSILPWAVMDRGTYSDNSASTNVGNGTDFATLAGNNLAMLTTYSTAISGVSTNNVKITDTTVAGLAGANSVNSLILTGVLGANTTTGVDGAGTLTVTSGALMVTTSTLTAAGVGGATGGNYTGSIGGLYTNNATIGSGLTLDFGTAEAVITTTANTAGGATGSSTLTVNGPVTGTGGLTKSGGGKLTLTGDNSGLSGNVHINSGTVLANNSTGTALGSGGVVVAKTATLGGTGSVSGAVTAAGTIAPGASVGTLTTGAVNLTGSLAVEVSKATADKLVSTGAINLTGSTLSVSLLAAATQPSFVIAEGSSITGTFSSVSLPPGYSVSYFATQVVLNTAPTGFDAWKALPGNGLTAGVNDGPAADPDNDGINNLLEFVLGGIPAGAGSVDPTIGPVQTLNATQLIVTFKRSDLSEGDLVLKVQWSADLVSWGAPKEVVIGAVDSGIVDITEDVPNASLDTVQVTIPRTGNEVNGKLFARVSAVRP